MHPSNFYCWHPSLSLRPPTPRSRLQVGCILTRPRPNARPILRMTGRSTQLSGFSATVRIAQAACLAIAAPWCIPRRPPPRRWRRLSFLQGVSIADHGEEAVPPEAESNMRPDSQLRPKPLRRVLVGDLGMMVDVWLGCERRVIPADGLFRHDDMPKPFC